MSAGLLTIDDLISHVNMTNKIYNFLILPGIIFDIFGNDLTGKNYKILKKELDLDIVII